jgi:uncharacterized protein YidB (DUF937 family)
MSRGMPSMVALLGLLAVAGYQNRDKLAEMLAGSGQNKEPRPQGSPAGGSQGGLGGLLGGSTAGAVLTGGLGELLDRFKQAGQGETADSWVKTGPNKPVSADELGRAIGPDVLATLSQQTGLSREELLSRLSRDLPKAVDSYTPDGRIPDPDEIDRQA